MKISQEQRVIERLKADGMVSRNWALSQFITRLSAIVQSLEASGWVFEAHWVKTDHGRDYQYRVVSPAMRTITKVIEREGKFYPTQIQVPV